MRHVKQKKGPLGAIAIGISAMSVMYGWIAYAGEIESDNAAVASYITQASNGQIVIDPDKINLLNQVDNSVETQQNSQINTELYGLSPIAPADAMITKHFSNYCSPLGGTGNSCPSDPLQQFGDVKVSSVLFGTAYDNSRAQAAQDFLTNLLNPPSGAGVTNFQGKLPINAATVTQDPALKDSFVKALSDEAILSVIRMPFAEMMAKRTVNSDSVGYSEMQMMEQQAIQRFMSSGWANHLTNMTPAELAKDQALMQAYQIWMDYQRYRQMERVEALLAVLLLQNFKGSKAAAAVANQAPTQDQIDQAVQKSGGSGSNPDTSSGQ